MSKSKKAIATKGKAAKREPKIKSVSAKEHDAKKRVVDTKAEEPSDVAPVVNAVEPAAAAGEASATEAANGERRVTFAIRIPESESVAIHRAAGKSNASRLAREVLAAAAGGDLSAFEEALERARVHREKRPYA